MHHTIIELYMLKKKKEERKKKKKKKKEEQNWNFHIQFSQLLERFMEQWEYILH